MGRSPGWYGQLARIAVAAAILFALQSTVQAEVFKCVNKATGKTSFSDVPCATGEDGRPVKINSGNTFDGSVYRQQESQAHAESAIPVQARPQTSQTANNRPTSADLKKFCSNIKPSPRGYTANQLQMLAECAGLHGDPQNGMRVQSGQLPVAMPAPAQAGPLVITDCNSSGCWDNQGGRYDKGAGNTYFPAAGGPACHNAGGQMACP